MKAKCPRKPLKGYRTVLVNLLMLGGVALFWDPLQQQIDAQKITALVTAINLWLRMITSGPLGTKL